MVVQPINSSTREITARTRFLAPSFEVERARLLGMPFEEEVEFIPWEEHWNPYSTLLQNWDTSSPSHTHTISNPKVMVDDEIRDFIPRGLSLSGFNVAGLGGEVEKVKQTKTPGEVELVRAVNTGTVEAVRAMRKCMYPGLTENEVMNVLDDTLRAAGLEPFFDIVLFGTSPPFPLPKPVTDINERRRCFQPPRRYRWEQSARSRDIRAHRRWVCPPPHLPLSLINPVPIYTATPPTSAGLSSRLSSLNRLPSLIFHQPSRKN
jgi:hypothetical protein